MHVGGHHLVVSSYDLSLRYERLRAELQCHEGYFALASVTDGVHGKDVSPSMFKASGEIHIECENAWTLLCLLMRSETSDQFITWALVSRLPGLVAAALSRINGLVLGPGCDGSSHNTVTLLPFDSAECCENSFEEDQWGCMVGGQFNGRVPGVRTEVSSVRCERRQGSLGSYFARCDTLPGYYHEMAPGTCREGPLPAWTPLIFNESWYDLHWGLRALAWGDLVLTIAAYASILACCCGFRRRNHRGGRDYTPLCAFP